jgi:thioredoxin reductase (NADPH)
MPCSSINSQTNIYDVIIIGGGPAGLTAGLYAGRAKLNVLILRSYSITGQAVSTGIIENYPGFPDGISGMELIERIENQLNKLELKILPETVESIMQKEDNIWEIRTEDDMYYALSLIIATGAKPKELSVPGENIFRGKGVSYCATCDGMLYKDKDVVVVGGGDTAVEEALFLTRFTQNIRLIHRRDKLRAIQILQDRILADKHIKIMWNTEIVRIYGDDRVRGVVVQDVNTHKESELPCDGVFIFIGTVPNTEFLNDIVRLDDNGYIITDEDMSTSRAGIFACGDCRKKTLRQIITACGDGAIAAYSVQRYIERLKYGSINT